MQSQHIRLWSLSLSLALFLFLITGFSTTVLASPPTPPPGGRQTLSGHQVPALHGLTPLGATDGNRTLQLTISLQLADPAGLKALIVAQNNPQSPLYHQYLTPQQFTDRFAPSQVNVDAVASFLKSQGLKVAAVSTNRLSITAEGTVSKVEQAFQVHISDYALNGRTVYAPSTDPSVPASLATLILNIGGLDNASIPHRIGFQTSNTNHTVKPGMAATGPNGGYTPSELRTAYDVNPLITAGADGSSQTVAIVELDGYSSSDVNQYLSFYNLGSPKYSNVLLDGATNTPGKDAIEVELDMEVVSAIAPGAAQKIYIAPNGLAGFQGFYDDFSQIVTDDTAKVVSNSWGLCEALTGTSSMQAFDNVFAQGAAQGQAFFSASGDSGAYDCGNAPLGVDFPASDPYVVGVGGTTLNTGSGGSYTGEMIWNNSYGSDGGGLSSFFTQPSYQVGPGVINQYSNGKREVPDVSADADPATGYSVYCTAGSTCNGAGWLVVGGTSAAAPLWAAVATNINQFLSIHSKATLGSASTALYSAFNLTQGFPPFHDITSGNGNNGFYPADYGYDMASGIGTPDAWNLARDLGGFYPTVTPGYVSLATAPGVNPAPQTLTIHNNDLGAYNWVLNWDAYPCLSVSSPTGTIPTGGTSTVTITFNFNSPGVCGSLFSFQDLNSLSRPITVPVTLVAAQVSKTWYFAEGYTGGSFSEYLTLENPNATSAQVTVTYLLDKGQAPIVKTYTINPNQRFTKLVNEDVGANQNVSMSISSDQPIVAERPMYFTYTALPGYTIPGGTDVLGATQLSQNFDFGYLDTTPGHDPYLTFLNPNGVAMNVTIQYFGTGGGTPTTTHHTFTANSRGTINVRTDEGLPAGTYSALVSLDQPGLVERPMYFKDGVTGYTGSADVVGVAQPQFNWYFAEGYTNTNFSERYYLSNPNTSQSVSANVLFYLSNGSQKIVSVSIPAGGQVVVDANQVLGNNVNNSVEVDASSLPILVERFMSFDYTAAIGGNQHPSILGATDVLGTGAPSNLFYFAEGYDGTGFAEYLTIENPTIYKAYVTVTFYPDNGAAPTVRTYVIGSTSRFTLFTADVLPNAAFSMQVESTVPIVAERPMYFNYLNSGQTGGSDVVGYEPFPGGGIIA